MLEQQCRAAGAQHAIGHLGDLEMGIDGLPDALEVARILEGLDEFTQIAVGHGQGRYQTL